MNSPPVVEAGRRPILVEVFNSVQGAAFFKRLLEEWRKAGNQLIAHNVISEDDYRASRGLLGRVALRWRMYGGYAWLCWREARNRRPESTVRVVTTNPFFAPALVKWTAGSRGKTVNLLYDLFPDALIQSGTIGADAWMAQWCTAITRYSLRESDVTVFLGERLRRHAETTYGAARRSIVIPVGADGAPFRDSPPQSQAAGTIPTILYSGQMGRMHEMDTLLAYWRQAPSQDVRWSFFASGKGYEGFKKKSAGVINVEWGGALHDTAWREVMRNAQVALVTVASGAERVVMPSKTYSALVAGQAVLAVCSRESDLADLVFQHDCGWVVEPGDVSGLHQALSEIAGNSGRLLTKRRNAYEAGHRYYDMTRIAVLWDELFMDLTSPPPAVGSGRNASRAE